MADESDITLNGKPLSELRVVDLKRELEQRGLSKGGSKTQLTDRLRAQLVLEKRHSEAQAASSGDEAKAPNLALQDDEVTGQNDFIKQYLLQQQRNLERQMEFKKKVEEERKRQSAEESADESQQSVAEEEMKAKDVTSEAEVKVATDAPAGVSTSDLEMAKSRSRHYRSKEKNEASKKREVVESSNEKGDADSTEPEVKKSKQTRSASPEERLQRRRHRSRSSSSSLSRTPERSQSSKGQKADYKHGRRRGSRKESRSSSRSPSPKISQRGRAESQRSSRHWRSSRTSRSRSKSPEDVPDKTLARRSSRRSAAQASKSSSSVQQLTEESMQKDQERTEGTEGRGEGKVMSSPDDKVNSSQELPTSSNQISQSGDSLSEQQKDECRKVVAEDNPQKSLATSADIRKDISSQKETTQPRQKEKSGSPSKESAEIAAPKPKRVSRWGRSGPDSKGDKIYQAAGNPASEPDTSLKSSVSADEISGQQDQESSEGGLVFDERNALASEASCKTDSNKEELKKEAADRDTREGKLSKGRRPSGREGKKSFKDDSTEDSEQKEENTGDSSKELLCKGKTGEQASDVPSSTETDNAKEKEEETAEKKKEQITGGAIESSRLAESRYRRGWRKGSAEDGAKSGQQEKSSGVSAKDCTSKPESSVTAEECEEGRNKVRQEEDEEMPKHLKDYSKDVIETSEAADDKDSNMEKTTSSADFSVSSEKGERETPRPRAFTSQDVQDLYKPAEVQKQLSNQECSPSKEDSMSRSPDPKEKSRERKRRDSSSSASSASRSRSNSHQKRSSSSSSGSRSSDSRSSSDTEEDQPRMRSTAQMSLGKRRSHPESSSRSPSPSRTQAKGDLDDVVAHGSRRSSDTVLKKKREANQEKKSNESPPSKLTKVSGTSDTDETGKDVSNDKKEAAKIEARSFRRLGSSHRVSSEGLTAEKDKPARKRKWGSSKTSTPKQRASIAISTDSLKGLIDDVRLPAEPILDLEFGEPMLLEAEDQDQATDKRDVKIKRTVVMRDGEETEEDARQVEGWDDVKEAAGEAENNPSSKKSKVDKSDKQPKVSTDLSSKKVKAEKHGQQPKKEAVKNEIVEKVKAPEPAKGGRHVNAPLVAPDEPEVVARELSPPRRPVSCVVHVMNLVRPFTLGQLKQLLSRTGKLVESGFWINSIKSHCYVTYEKEEEAVKTREALHGARWPQSNPKVLRVDFATPEEIERRRAEEEGGPVAPRPQPPPPKAPSPPVVRERERDRDREKRPAPEQEKKREEKPVREWDRGKRSRSPERGPAVRPSSRSRERPRDKEKEREREHRHPEHGKTREKKEKRAAPVEQPKVEEEPPAKLLDDLFRKTKATPCIYWLPVTEEQYQQKMQAKKERAIQRQKRMEQEDAEEEASRRKIAEQRHREAPPSPTRERAERDRQRERENELIRQRERQKEREREEGRERRRQGAGNDSRERGGHQERSSSRGHDRRRR